VVLLFTDRIGGLLLQGANLRFLCYNAIVLLRYFVKINFFVKKVVESGGKWWNLSNFAS
jgi:hypothetical protein